MITPTDDQINRLCAEICGWIPPPINLHNWRNPSGEYAIMPKFCTDRNALPELYQKVEEVYKCNDFGWNVLTLNLIRSRKDLSSKASDLWYVVTSPPRLVCIAALRALGKWPEDWSIE